MNYQAPIKSIRAEGTAEDAFAKTLRELMLAKRISASDLAREIWGTMKDGRGYEVARNRDRVGHYLSGKSFPTRDNLVKIAKALGVKVEVLENVQPLPVVRAAKPTKGPKDIEVIFITDGANSGIAHMTMTKMHLVPKTVIAIMDLIGKDPIQAAKSKDKKKSK